MAQSILTIYSHCRLPFLLLARRRFLPHTQIDHTFSSSGILLISHCKYWDKSLFSSGRAEKAAGDKQSHSSVLFPWSLTSSLPAPPSAWSERWYRTMELQMPPIRLGERSEALSVPLHDITVAWSWWKDKLSERVAQCHLSLTVSTLPGKVAMGNRVKAKHWLRKKKGCCKYVFTGLEVHLLRLIIKAFKITVSHTILSLQAPGCLFVTAALTRIETTETLQNCLSEEEHTIKYRFCYS